MITAARPEDEEARLQALYALRMLDTDCEEAYDRLVRLASNVFKTPFAMMTLIDRDRQFLKSCIDFERVEVARDLAFCSHTILEDKPLVVVDTRLDARFAGSPFVKGEPHIHFYAGVPIASMDGHRLGALCVLDTRPRDFDASEVAMLTDIAMSVQELVHNHELKRRTFRAFIRTWHRNMVVT